MYSALVFFSFSSPIDGDGAASSHLLLREMSAATRVGSQRISFSEALPSAVTRRTSCTTSAAFVCDGNKPKKKKKTADGHNPWPGKKKDKNLIPKEERWKTFLTMF